MRHPSSARSMQEGSILLVAVIFLVFFTLVAMSIFKGSLTSVKSIGNMQWRAESISAANDAIDRILSSKDAFTDPKTFTTTVNATPYAYDANGDGVNDVYVTLPVVDVDGVKRAGPRCARIQPIATKDLDPANPEDVNCMSSAGSVGGLVQETASGVEFVAPSISLCANTEWSVTVHAEDKVTNTNVDVVQGVGVRVLTTSVDKCD